MKPLAERTGVWRGRDLLASPGRMAEGGRWNRLHALLLDKLRESGQLDFRMLPSILPLCGLLGRAKNRANPDGSRATGFEAPHPRRRQRSTGQFDIDRRRPSRRHRLLEHIQTSGAGFLN